MRIDFFVKVYPAHFHMPDEAGDFSYWIMRGNKAQRQYIPAPQRVEVAPDEAVVVADRGLYPAALQGFGWITNDKALVPGLVGGV